MQTDATLLDVTCCVRLHTLLHVVTLLRVVAQSLKPVKLFSQQLPTFLLFRDRRSVAQQCWIRLHTSSNIVGAKRAHYAWFTKTYGLYPSHDALQVPALLGVVASVCTPLPTHSTNPNIIGVTMLGVVASVCTQPNTQDLPVVNTQGSSTEFLFTYHSAIPEKSSQRTLFQWNS